MNHPESGSAAGVSDAITAMLAAGGSSFHFPAKSP
jgi:hypothetical protein